MPEAEPRSVVSLGGRFGYEDQGQTPNTQLTVFDCGDVRLFCEQRGLITRETVKVTVDFHTTEGVVRDPSALVMTTASPPSITATTEFVVPRSMPMIFFLLMWWLPPLAPRPRRTADRV